MKLTRRVKEILSWYESDNPGTKANLARILMEGKLGGTGRMVILPVDQGFEHGPARSFAPNPAAWFPVMSQRREVTGARAASASASPSPAAAVRPASIAARLAGSCSAPFFSD